MLCHRGDRRPHVNLMHWRLDLKLWLLPRPLTNLFVQLQGRRQKVLPVISRVYIRILLATGQTDACMKSPNKGFRKVSIWRSSLIVMDGRPSGLEITTYYLRLSPTSSCVLLRRAEVPCGRERRTRGGQSVANRQRPVEGRQRHRSLTQSRTRLSGR